MVSGGAQQVEAIEATGERRSSAETTWRKRGQTCEKDGQIYCKKTLYFDIFYVLFSSEKHVMGLFGDVSSGSAQSYF